MYFNKLIIFLLRLNYLVGFILEYKGLWSEFLNHSLISDNHNELGVIGQMLF